MVNQIKTSYSHCSTDKCQVSNKVSFYIKDVENSKCVVTVEMKDSTVFVENKSNDLIHFFAVDQCLIKTVSIQKCDCCVTNNKNRIVFIELKEVSFTKSNKKNRAKRAKYRKTAVDQLGSTINDFIANGINFDGYVVEALISYPPYVTETNPTTIPKSSSQARIAQFSSICGFTELSEGNYLVF